MKHLILVPTLLVVLPGAAHAQIDLVLSGSRPAIRANIAGLTLSAGIGSRGKLDVRVDEVGAVRSSIPTTRPARRSTSTPGSTSRSTSRSARANAAAVLNTADAYVGTKYVWGGSTPSGFDCSGFVQYVFRKHGVELPRTSRQQAKVGQALPPSISALEVGDLMFFASNGSRIDHIAIYAGNDQIIHSSSSGGGVGYDDLYSKRGRYFATHHVATRRVLEGGSSLVGPLTAALRAFTQFDPPDRAPRR